MAEGNSPVPELSEPNRSPMRSGPEACRDELRLEPTPELVPIPKGSNKSPTAGRPRGGTENKIREPPKHFIVEAVRGETRTFRVRRGGAEENVFLHCCFLTSRWCKEIVEKVAVAGSRFHSSLEPLRGSRGGVCRGLRVRVQPQQVGRVTDRGVLGGGGRVLEGGDKERNQNMKSENEEKLYKKK